MDLLLIHKSILVALIACFTGNAFGQSHCATDETEYFSCQIKKSFKIISLCGNAQNSELKTNGWLQYRFGVIGKPELTYPSSKSNSSEKFELNYFHPREDNHEVIDLRFLNGKSLYSIELVRASSHIVGGINVMTGKKRISLNCDGEVNKLYWSRLLSLPENPNTDRANVLSEFYKNNAK